MQISTEKYETLIDEIADLRSKQPKWISVKDRLPETVKPVVFIALEPDGQSACAWVAWSDQKEDALYWAELPELPEVEDNEAD